MEKQKENCSGGIKKRNNGNMNEQTKQNDAGEERSGGKQKRKNIFMIYLNNLT